MSTNFSGRGMRVFWGIVGLTLAVESALLASRWFRAEEPVSAPVVAAQLPPRVIPKAEPRIAVAEVAESKRRLETPPAPPEVPPAPVATPPVVNARQEATHNPTASTLKNAVPPPVTNPSTKSLATAKVRDEKPVVPANLPPLGEVDELGRKLFLREWTPHLAARPKEPDGLGPLYNDTSCFACHGQSGLGGGGPATKNVVLLRPRTGGGTQMIHHFGTSPKHENWRLGMLSGKSLSLNPRDRVLSNVSQRNSTALFGAGAIDSIPDKVLLHAERDSKALPNELGAGVKKGRLSRVNGGKIGRFGWKGQTPSLYEFTLTACAVELGLNVPGHGQSIPAYQTQAPEPGLDLTQQECDALVSYLRQLPAPRQRLPLDEPQRAMVGRGQERFARIGCADCHRANLGKVEGIYSDLLLHDMGLDLSDQAGSYYSEGNTPIPSAEDSPAIATEWRTPPLWGCRDSAPYMHDGRAENLEQAIAMHSGQGRASSRKFQVLQPEERLEVLEFLKSLAAPDEPVQVVRMEREGAR